MMGEQHSGTPEHPSFTKGVQLAAELLHQPNSAEQTSTTEYQFVFCAHDTEERGAEAAKALANADIIALELVGSGSVQDREHLAEAWTSALAAGGPPENLDQLLDSLKGDYEARPFMRGLLRQLADSDKHIVFIDAADDHESMSIRDQQAKIMSERYIQTLQEAQPNEVSAQALAANIRLIAQSHSLREATVIEQLKSLDSSHQGTPHRVGVMLGMSHTPVQHALHRDGHSTARSFVDSVSQSDLMPIEKARHSLRAEATRWQRLHPNDELKSSLLQRVMLADLYQATKHYSAGEQLIKADGFVRDLTNEEVAQAMAGIDNIKKLSRDTGHTGTWLANAEEYILEPLRSRRSEQHPWRTAA